MSQNDIEAYLKNSCRVAASGTAHRHVYDSLMGFRFSAVVAVVKLEGLQILITAIALRTLAVMTVSSHTISFRTRGEKQHQSLSSIIQKD